MCVLGCIFENEKIKNGLKSFKLEKGNGESFSYVQSMLFFVHSLAFFVNNVMILHICLVFLLDYLSFLYIHLGSTLWTYFCIFDCTCCIIDYNVSILGNNDCTGGY